MTHALDMQTVAKRDFLETFTGVVTEPRELDYKIMFPGPAGANAVEAALKLARKVTGRESIVNFTNAFHGMTLGALSVTGNSMKRGGAGIPLVHATPMPYDNYLDGRVEDFLWFERLLDDSGSGLNEPAAVIVETVQGEGGINVARDEWLRGLADLCKRHDMLLIVDDVQMGCGRTGPFFSFESAGIDPGHRVPVQVDRRLRPAARDDAAQAGARHLGAGRAQRHVPRHQPGVRRRPPRRCARTGRDDKLEKSTLAKGEQVGRVMTGLAEELPGTPMLAKGRGLARGLCVRVGRGRRQRLPRRVRARPADGDVGPGGRGREGHAGAHRSPTTSWPRALTCCPTRFARCARRGETTR